MYWNISQIYLLSHIPLNIELVQEFKFCKIVINAMTFIPPH